MIMIVSVPMVMNNRGTICVEQTQVLDSKGIDPCWHAMTIILMVLMIVIKVVIINMRLERFCCNHTISSLGKKFSSFDIFKAFSKFSLADQNILLI